MASAVMRSKQKTALDVDQLKRALDTSYFRLSTAHTPEGQIARFVPASRQQVRCPSAAEGLVRAAR
jgi:hypothetical protein